MAQPIREVMTSDPHTVEPDATVADAARVMAQDDIGAVLVTEQGRVSGILTDRDIVGDLAIERDPGSALADLSSEPGTT